MLSTNYRIEGQSQGNYDLAYKDAFRTTGGYQVIIEGKTADQKLVGSLLISDTQEQIDCLWSGLTGICFEAKNKTRSLKRGVDRTIFKFDLVR